MIEKFRKIFTGLEERFGYHQIDTSVGDGKKSGTSFTSSYAHTEEMWKAHLEGTKFEVKTKNKTIQADKNYASFRKAGSLYRDGDIVVSGLQIVFDNYDIPMHELKIT